MTASSCSGCVANSRAAAQAATLLALTVAAVVACVLYAVLSHPAELFAAAAWLARQGRVASRVRVTQAGGTLWVETDPGTGTVTLEGPAAHVFEGTLE